MAAQTGINPYSYEVLPVHIVYKYPVSAKLMD